VSRRPAFTAGVVLAAGGSARLGRPKQLLAYRGRTLLDGTLDIARSCAFDQLIVTVGGAADDVRTTVDLTGCVVVDSVHFADGCSSSIVAALDAVDERADGVVLLLGDQPGIDPSTVATLLETVGASADPLGACRYRDGRGHPFWVGRPLFDDLRTAHGDKAVWRLLESRRWPVSEVDVDGPVPLDVDTVADYERLLRSTG
jgi:molybdenum cofactor cytidylyltransferase